MQTSFSELGYAAKKKQTRRDRFLADIEQSPREQLWPLWLTISLINEGTHESMFTCIGSTEADDIREAITNCLPREALNQSSMSRIAVKIVMITSRATQVVAWTMMPRSAVQRGCDFGATRLGTGIAGRLLRCARYEGHQPFAASHILHPIPQYRVCDHVGLVQCFLKNYHHFAIKLSQPVTIYFS